MGNKQIQYSGLFAWVITFCDDSELELFISAEAAFEAVKKYITEERPNTAEKDIASLTEEYKADQTEFGLEGYCTVRLQTIYTVRDEYSLSIVTTKHLDYFDFREKLVAKCEDRVVAKDVRDFADWYIAADYGREEFVTNGTFVEFFFDNEIGCDYCERYSGVAEESIEIIYKEICEMLISAGFEHKTVIRFWYHC